MTMRAVLYARVSTDEQGKGYSLPTQLEALRKYAQGKKNVIVGEFSDTHTGTELDRPGLNQVYSFIEKEGADCLIVYEIDRLSREVGNQAIIEMEMAKAGVQIEYVLGQYDNSAEGELMKLIKSGIAQYENRQRVERSRRGKMGRARAGYVICPGARAPFGYDYKSEPHKGWFVINEREAEAVRKMYAWTTQEGLSSYRVAKRLWQENILTRGDYSHVVHKKAGPGAWSPKTVIGMLRNAVYKGVWYYGKTRRTKIKGKTVQLRVPKSEWIAVPVPAIVDEETWDRAQECIANKKLFAKRNAKRHYLLRGLVFCPCGRRRVGMYKTHLKRAYYRCPANESRAWLGRCSYRWSVRQEVLENAVWNTVASFFLNPENLRDEIARRRAEASGQMERKSQRLDEVEIAIAEVNRKMAVLLEQVLSGGFAQSVIDQKKSGLAVERANLVDEAERIKAELVVSAITPEQELKVEEFAMRVGEALGEQTHEEKRRILELIDARVDLLSPTEVKLSGMISDGLIVELSPARRVLGRDHLAGAGVDCR